MAKKKIKFNSRYLVVPVVLTIAMLLGLVVLSNKESKTTKLQNVYEVESDQKVEETIEDGVYTNHTYGFKFEYPEEMLNDIYDWKEATGKLFSLKGWTVPALWVKVGMFTEEEAFYNDCINAKLGEAVNLSVDNIKVNMANGFCVTQIGPQGIYGSPAKHWRYESVVKSRDGEYYLYILWEEDTVEDLRQHKEEFYSVINSFEFID